MNVRFLNHEFVSHVTPVEKNQLKKVWQEKNTKELTWVEPVVHFEVDQVRKSLPQQQPVHRRFPPHVAITVPRLAVPTATVL